MEATQARAYRLARRLLRSDEDARDAVQEAYLKAYVSLPRFEGRSSFYTWLHRLVVNQCIDMRRRARPERRIAFEDGDVIEELALEPEPAAVLPGPAAPLEELSRSELRERLSEAIEALPEQARDTLLLREVDGLSYAQIAEAQGIPRGTVMSRLHYARRRVERALRAAGIAPEEER